MQVICTEMCEAHQMLCLWQLVTPLHICNSCRLVCAKWFHLYHEKVQYCYWLAEFKVPKTAHHNFDQKDGYNPPNRHTVVNLLQQLLLCGNFKQHPAGGRLRMTPAQVKAIWEASQWNLQKSIHQANHEQWISCSEVHDIVCHWLKLEAYKFQLLEIMQENDLTWHYDYAADVVS
jgi:hypothetical protein